MSFMTRKLLRKKKLLEFCDVKRKELLAYKWHKKYDNCEKENLKSSEKATKTYKHN